MALTWALEIVAYGRSGMLVGCVGTGELKLQGSEKRMFRQTGLFRPVASGLESSAFKNLEGQFLSRTLL
ncbi:MAG TPA: hypothetical protein VIQ24_21450 [Pyrinomonadaceae bacterium]